MRIPCYYDVMLLHGSPTILAVRDLSTEMGGMTVTNAAEDVVRELSHTYRLRDLRIVYR